MKEEGLVDQISWQNLMQRIKRSYGLVLKKIDKSMRNTKVVIGRRWWVHEHVGAAVCGVAFAGTVW